MRLVVLRHGRTAWNAARRIQGRSDQPLDDRGRRQVRDWRLQPDWPPLPCSVSPLRRAVETARILGFSEFDTDDRLIEMDWGDYCGRRVAELRSELGDTFRQNEAQGVDFLPEGGESPRQVAQRVDNAVRDSARAGRDCLYITHKGVRRAMLVLACGWDMLGRPPVKLAQDDAMVMQVSAAGGMELEEIVSLRGT